MATKTLNHATAPDWLVGEMPAGYQTRFAEIQRLSAEMNAMDKMARLLWETGTPLYEAVRDTFASFKFDVDDAPNDARVIVVKLDPRRRLLMYVAVAETAIEKKSPELATIFKIVHEIAGNGDRAVLVTNVDRTSPPKSRQSAVSADAADLLKRLGANVLPATTLFALWSQSQQDSTRVRTYLDRFHEQDGGTAPTIG